MSVNAPLRLPVFITCLLLLALGACKTTRPTRTETPVYREKNVSPVNMNADIINLVNEIRKSKALPPLRILQSASLEAVRHSQDMAAGRVRFGHDGFRQRAIAMANDLNGSSATGENVAKGRMTAREVVTAWLKSSAHRANIEGNFTYTGVGVVKDSHGVLYYTQLFVKK